MRAAAVIVHRWVGLVLAGFLVLAGLTGSLLVWYHELDAAINPQWMRVPPAPAEPGEARARMLDPLELRSRVRAAFPGAEVNYVSFHQASPEDARAFYIEWPKDASIAPAEPRVDEVFVDPYTGQILGARKWGDLRQGLTNLMPFLYRLHYSLALGTVGTWIFGIVALLWTIDCFVGAWLTFPVASRGPSATRKGWLSRWRPAWSVRWGAGTYKLNFDLHRAGGLWLWALLFVLAWSSVAFNLHDTLYRPVMGTVFELQPDPARTAQPLPQPQRYPALGWPAALDAARAHMAEQARTHGFRILAEDRISYHPEKGYMRYVVRSTRDINERRGQTAVFVDARTGELIGTVMPTGAASADTITTWITTMHMAHLWGMPFRIVMTMTGLVVALLCSTGVVIWWKKRRARSWSQVGRASHEERPLVVS